MQCVKAFPTHRHPHRRHQVQRCPPCWPPRLAAAAVLPAAAQATPCRWWAQRAGRQSDLRAASAGPPPLHPAQPPLKRRCAACHEGAAAAVVLPRRPQTWACWPGRLPWLLPGLLRPSAGSIPVESQHSKPPPSRASPANQHAKCKCAAAPYAPRHRRPPLQPPPQMAPARASCAALSRRKT